MIRSFRSREAAELFAGDIVRRLAPDVQKAARRKLNMKKRLPPIHPGEILLEEFMKPRGLTQYRVAKDIRVPPRRINEIVHGLRAVSADTALRLGRYFGTAPQFWLNLQSGYDLDVEGARLKDRLEAEVRVLPSAGR